MRSGCTGCTWKEGLVLKRKKPKRRRAAVARQEKPTVTRPNERWAMDSMHDMLFDGRSMRVLTVIDLFTRECLELKVRQSFRGEHVAQVLSDLIARHGRPRTIQCDQGPEFTSMALDRRECLTHHYFLDLNEAAGVLNSWKEEYIKVRPHGSLGQLTPASYGAGWSRMNGPERLQKCG
jgi:putative transposase